MNSDREKELDIEALKEKYGDMKIDSSLNRLLEQGDNYLTIKDVKKALKITDKDIAEWFGYKSAVSYRNAERKKNIEDGIVELYKRIKKD